MGIFLVEVRTHGVAPSTVHTFLFQGSSNSSERIFFVFDDDGFHGAGVIVM